MVDGQAVDRSSGHFSELPPAMLPSITHHMGKNKNKKMSTSHFPIGLEIDVFYPSFQVRLMLLSMKQLRFEIEGGPYARTETVEFQVVPLGDRLFAVSWQEQDGATVTSIQDYDRGLVHSFATLPDGQFLRMTGMIAIARSADRVSDNRPRRAKAW